MTGDCHVRFCERLRGEIPLCLLGVVQRGINTKHQSPQRSWTRIQKNFAFYVPLYCPKEETQSIKVHKGAGLESIKLCFLCAFVLS
jgi:hypothetical protein